MDKANRVTFEVEADLYEKEAFAEIKKANCDPTEGMAKPYSTLQMGRRVIYKAKQELARRVEVVRCKDCKYFTYDGYHKHYYCAKAKGLRYSVLHAKSYKIQKYLDTIPINEKPDILQTGHIHQAFYYKQDNTHCFQTSCLEDQTPYCRGLGLANDKSCWWVDVEFDDKGNVFKIKPELETFEKKLIRNHK